MNIARVVFCLSALALVAGLPTAPPFVDAAVAQTTDCRFPAAGGCVSDSSRGGTGNIAWTSPGNAVATAQPDGTNTYATSDLASASQNTQYLNCTNFGFGIPAANTITGIEVRWEVSENATPLRVSDDRVRVVKGGTIQATDKADAVAWPTTDNVKTYGGSADLWALSWTPSDINATDFGAALSAVKDATGNNRTARVDSVQICVSHVAPTPTPTVTQTLTSTPTQTSTATSTNTPLPTDTYTPVPTHTFTPVPTHTFTPVPTDTYTPVPTDTYTPVPTDTSTPVPTHTFTPIPTDTPTPVPTDTFTPVPTDTYTPVPTDTFTPVPTDTFTPIPTDTPTPVPTDTFTPVPTDTYTPVPTDTFTPVPTDTFTPIPTDTPAPVPTDTFTPVPTDTYTPVPTDTFTPLPTDTSTPIIASPTPTPTATPTPTVAYPVTFGYAIGSPNTLMVTVTASVTCPDTCPSFDYDWDWGDGTAHGSGQTDSHLYAGSGTKLIRLTVTLGGEMIGSAARSLMLYNPDLPPTVGGTCTWNANTWTMTVLDAATDDGPDADMLPGDGTASLQIVVDWGDGGGKTISTQGATISHTYMRTGTFTVTHKANDSKLQQASRTCPTQATPAYFTIAGTVYKSDGTTPVYSASVTLLTSPAGTIVKTVTTPANGTFLLGSLKPGTYTITVKRSGYTFPVTGPITIGPDALAIKITATVP